MIRPASLAPLALAVASIALLASCAGNPPRFGEIGISAAAPRATLSGRTTERARPAVELSPGCPGFVDPETPEHVFRVEGGTPLVVSASSPAGPLALAVSGGFELRCDSDGGTGHSPHVSIDAPGEYRVYVGALERAMELPYQLVVAPAADGPLAPTDAPDGDVRVSLTITSDPPNATVLSASGEVLGTTPAMLALAIPRAEVGQERRFYLAMEGHQGGEVIARMQAGAMALHASLPPNPRVDPILLPPDVGPVTGELVAASSEPPVPILDRATVEQHADVASDCTIQRMSVALDLQHSYVADLRVVLRAPSGVEVVLHNQQAGSRRALVTTIGWDDRRGALRVLSSQNARGRWTLSVTDAVNTETGTLNRFSLRFTCGTPSAVRAWQPTSRPNGGLRVPSVFSSPRGSPRGSLGGALGSGSPNPSVLVPPTPRPPPPARRSNRSNSPPQRSGDGLVDPWTW